MADLESHKKIYEKFRKDAENQTLFEGTRVEAYFMAAFHLIEACAAKNRLHINKHQLIRSLLENNKFVFGEETEIVWRAFQRIENQLRPKFVYGTSWTDEDLDETKLAFDRIEKVCLKVLESG